MKIRSFLTAVSAVALMAGTAHANPLGFRMVNTDGINDNSQEALINLALESNDLNSGPVFIEFEIFDVAGAEFPSGDDLDIVVTLPEGMAFATPGANSPDVVNGTAGSVTGASLTSGGASSDLMARYAVSLDDRIGRDNFTIGFRIPVQMDLGVCRTEDKADPGSYDVKVDVTVLNEGGDPLSGTPIFGQTVSGANARVLQCVDGIVADVNSDEPTNDTIIALSDYNTFLPAFGFIPVDDTLQLPLQGTTNIDQGQTSLSPIGVVDYVMNTNAVIKLGPTTGTNNFLDETDVEDLGFTVQWENVTGMTVTGAQLVGRTGVFGVPNDTASNSADFIYGDGAIAAVLNGITTRIFAASDINAEIEEQRVAVIDSFVTFTSDSMGVSEFDDDLCGNGPLDTLTRQGRRFGFFDWVGDEDRQTRNVFRLSGLPTLADGSSPEDIELDIIFNNSVGGPAFDGRFDLTIPAAAISNGVVSINNIDLSVINPGYGQSDILILVQDTSRDIDVDRLQIDPAGSLNNFGDGANFGLNIFGEVTPVADGDDELGSE